MNKDISKWEGFTRLINFNTIWILIMFLIDLQDLIPIIASTHQFFYCYFMHLNDDIYPKITCVWLMILIVFICIYMCFICINFFIHKLLILKKNFDAIIKLLSCDLEVTSSSPKNNLLQNKIRLCIIDPSLGSRIEGSFVYRVTLYKLFMLLYIMVLISLDRVSFR